MIQLSKINGIEIYINPDLIRWVEVTPDTLVTFSDGKQIMVKEKPDEIINKVIAFRKACKEFVVKE